MNILFYFFTFIFGLIIGSFLNCFIYRLEKEETLAGRSYCPHCKHSLMWLDLIPVFSFLLLGGKCRYCSKKISIQYPLVEFLTASIFLLIFMTTPDLAKTGIFLNIFFLWYIASVLIIIFVYDLKFYLIPDSVLFPAIAIIFLFRISDFGLRISPLFTNYLLAVMIASGFFLGIFLISRGRWMGFGDVKLAILLGLLLGFPNILVGLFLAFLLGAVAGLTSMALHKKGLKSEMPFAPFLILGTFFAFFGGRK